MCGKNKFPNYRVESYILKGAFLFLFFSQNWRGKKMTLAVFNKAFK